MTETSNNDLAERFGWNPQMDIPSLYPWFMTPQLVGPDMRDPLTALHIATHPAPETLLMEIHIDGAGAKTPPPAEQAKSDTVSLIDKFLQGDEDHRIIPTDDTPEFDAAANSGELEITDDIATSQLAEIYRKQGMDREADEILRKLGANGGKKG